MEHFIEEEGDYRSPSGLRNALIATAWAVVIIAALYWFPGLTIAFAAGVLTALWFGSPPEDDILRWHHDRA